MEGDRSGRIKTFQDAYNILGYQGDISHPGHPHEPSSEGNLLRVKQLNTTETVSSHLWEAQENQKVNGDELAALQAWTGLRKQKAGENSAVPSTG